MGGLSYNFRSEPRNWYVKYNNRIKEVPISGPLHVNGLETILSSARAGLGLALLVEWSVNEDIAKGVLSEVLPGYAFNVSENFDESLNLIYLGQNPAPKVRVFVDFIIKEWKNPL